MYLNWAFTDTPAGTATSVVFASGDASQPIVTIAGPARSTVPPGASLRDAAKMQIR